MPHAVRFHSFGGPDVLKWEDLDVPAAAPGEARVRHHAIGLNYIDVYHRTGLYPISLPSGVGLEGAGVVEAVGDGVTAEHVVKQLMETQNLENVYLRVGVKGGGCSGLSYQLEFDNEIGPHDKKFDIDGVQVVCDKKSYLYLNGTTLDYVTQGLQGGFTFVNPSAKSSCGCGTSFSA